MLEREHKVSKISSDAIFAERPISSKKFLISTIICLSLIVIDLRFSTSNIFRGYAQDLISPFYNLSQIPFILYKSFSDLVISRMELKENLDKYKKDNHKLQVMNSQLVEMAKRNQELNLVWNLAQIDKEAYFLAQKRVLIDNSLRPRLILSVRNNDSVVKVNQPVLSTEGIVGKITSIGLGSVEVMMVHDPRSMVPIISSSSRIHGILQGRGFGKSGKLINIKKTANLKEGENIYSSGLGEVFPPNFFVGQIISVNDKADNEFLEVEVEFLDTPEEQDFFLIFTG